MKADLAALNQGPEYSKRRAELNVWRITSTRSQALMQGGVIRPGLIPIPRILAVLSHRVKNLHQRGKVPHEAGLMFLI